MSQLYTITPFSLLDFPNEVACIAWFSGCNFRCKYCHNPDIVLNKGDKEDADLISFLKKRKGLLTGVVFSGGEATFYKDLPTLMTSVKELGFKTKLDTNGTNPKVVLELLDNNSVDYIALDYKCPPNRSEKLLGTSKFDDAFHGCLKLLIAAKNIKLEIRTTFHSDYLDVEDIEYIINDLDELGYTGVYYVQNIETVGEGTLGNVSKSLRISIEQLPIPKNFTIQIRN